MGETATGTTTASTADGKAQLRELLAQFRKQLAPLLALADVKPASADAIELVAGALTKLPAGETFGQALEELRGQLERIVAETRQEQARALGRVEAEYIRAAREVSKPVRELDDGWRIGPVALHLRREQAQARASYNHEPLVPWTPIRAAEDLAKLEQRARDLLQGQALPEDALSELLWEAYEQAHARRERQRVAHPELIPILDFYAEFRIALLRQELRGQKPDRKFTRTELPRWAFLYNLDRYRALGAAVPEARRLGFQAGSQQEVQRGLGVTINGLDAGQDYRTVCNVIPARRPS